ncbi:MFS transporter [Nocardioides deserti]|uniref:MFS transporter n=1 Tax=Nocardioides deserti TaxID=1588644 RepID=A0ABR6U6J1_9ACTN|nr:MFS transporter [Nocardioides deserti]MBC2960046.1 MFS transporter [Nocardioides deserti]GGO75092.1 MFS transporter [Nocardioides deserti]
MPGQPPLRVAVWAGVMLGMISLASASVAVILPDVVDGFGLAAGSASWMISLYVLSLSVCTALYGRLADLFGIRKPLAVGVSLLAAGSVLAALAPTYGVLLVARAVQGVGAASMPSLLNAAVERSYGGSLRGRALAAVAGIAIGVGSIGPLVGGSVANLVGWRVALALPLVGLVAMVPVWRWLPTEGSGARIDLVGALQVVVAAAGVVLLLQSPGASWPAHWVGAGLVVVGVPLLLRHVRRVPGGFLPRAVLDDGRMLGLAVGGAVVPGAWFALMLVLPLTLDALAWEPWQVGAAMAPGALAGLIASRATPAVLARLGGPDSLLLTGIGTALLLLLCWVGVSADHRVLTPVLLVVTNFGVTGLAALAQSTLMGEVGHRFGLDVRGAAMGVMMLVFMLGAAFGSAALGGLSIALGMAPAVAVLACVCLVGPALVLIARRPA